MHRRSFLTAASLSAAGLSVPHRAGAQAAAPHLDGARDVPRYPQDAWFDQLPGKHRLFLDATNAKEAGEALEYCWNFLRTSTTGYNLKDADQAVVICLRHEATPFAFSNEIWRKYDILRKEEYEHPDTGKKINGGNVLRPGSTDPKSMDDEFTFDALARRGVHFAICSSATRRLARDILGKDASNEAFETLVDQFHAGSVANAHFMASGIVAAQRAGEYGYTVVKA